MAQQKQAIEAQLAQRQTEIQNIKNQYTGYVSPQVYQDQLAQKQALKNQYASYIHPSTYQVIVTAYNIVKAANNANYDFSTNPGIKYGIS